MNTKKQIVTLHLVRSIMILLMMGWTGGAWAQNGTVTEEVIYTTDFTDWTEEINRKQANQVVVNKICCPIRDSHRRYHGHRKD